MKKTLALSAFVVIAAGSSWVRAEAADHPGASLGHYRLRPPAPLLADNVVVTPGSGSGGGSTVAPAAPAAPQTVAAPAQQTVVDTPRTNKVVHTEVESSHNYMGTVALSALMGGVLGALVGGSVYYLGSRNNARDIAFWAAGGVLVGTGVGVVQIMVQENRASNATALNKLPSDPAPTFRLALLQTSF